MKSLNNWTLQQWREKVAPVTVTRYDFLGLTKSGPSCWRWLDLNDLENVSEVGPIYKTKAEALADLEDYVKRAWLPINEPR